MGRCRLVRTITDRKRSVAPMRLAWFLGLYLAGVVTVGAAAAVIRLMLPVVR